MLTTYFRTIFYMLTFIILSVLLYQDISLANSQDRTHYRYGYWDLYYNSYDYYFGTSCDLGSLVFHNSFNDYSKIGDDIFIIPKKSRRNIKDKQIVYFILNFGSKTVYAEGIYLQSKKHYAINCNIFKETVITKQPSYVNIYNKTFGELYSFSLEGYIPGYSAIANIANTISTKTEENTSFTNDLNKKTNSINELSKKTPMTEEERNFWFCFTLGALILLSILIIKLCSPKKDSSQSFNTKHTVYCPRCHCWLDYYFEDGDFVKCKKCGLEFNARKEYFKINNPEEAKQQAETESSKQKSEEAYRRAEQERQRREQEEARRRAEQERQRREQEGARQKAQHQDEAHWKTEEAKWQAEAEKAKRRAEEARHKAEQERIRRDQEEARRRAEQEKARREQESSRARRTSMTVKEAFDIFELPHTANFADVKKKRVFLLKFFHPDHHYEDKEAERFATEKARKINEAYEILKIFFEAKDG